MPIEFDRFFPTFAFKSVAFQRKQKWVILWTLNHLGVLQRPFLTFWDQGILLVACVAGAKRGGGGRKGKEKGAPALRAYVFA